jgi:hypothetical protein
VLACLCGSRTVLGEDVLTSPSICSRSVGVIGFFHSGLFAGLADCGLRYEDGATKCTGGGVEGAFGAGPVVAR